MMFALSMWKDKHSKLSFFLPDSMSDRKINFAKNRVETGNGR
jgi:hypothetical protein